MGQHRQLNAERRRDHGTTHPLGVAFVFRVHDHRDAGGQQLRAGRLDLDRPAVRRRERHPVVDALHSAVLDLGLRDGGLEVDLPHRGGRAGVRLTPDEVAQKAALRDAPAMVINRGVGEAPVDRKAHLAPLPLEIVLEFAGQALAELDEIAARNRSAVRVTGLDHQIGVVGQRRVALNAEVVLHPTLGRQAVVVPAHRVENGTSAHAVEPGHRVDLQVAESGAQVEESADGRRRGIDAVDARTRSPTIEAVGGIRLPHRVPLRLEPVESGPFRNLGHPVTLKLPNSRPRTLAAIPMATVAATEEGVRSPVADRFDHGCAAKTWAMAPPLKTVVLVGSMVSGSRKSCSPAPDDRVDDEAVLVDQAGLDQRSGEPCSALSKQLSVCVLLLEPRDGCGQVSGGDRRLAPVAVLAAW